MKSVRKRIVDTTKQYSSSTTIHGIAYLCGDRISGTERLLWAVVVSLALYLATYQVIKLYNDWQKNPVLTTLDTVALPIEQIEFPAVTICPQGSRKEIVDLVLFRQLIEHMQGAKGNRSKRSTLKYFEMFTEEELVERAVAFLNDVYPGASGDPTTLTRLMTSGNPKVTIEHEAILNKEEECDSSSNAAITRDWNKWIRNDKCPKGFEMAQESNYCVHAVSTPMTYKKASQHCNDLSGSSLLYLNKYEDLSHLSGILHFSGSIMFC